MQNNGPNRNQVRFHGRGPRNMFTEKPKNMKSAISRLIRYLASFKTTLIFMVFIILIATASSIVSPIIQRNITDAIDKSNNDLFITLLFALGTCYVFDILCAFFKGIMAAKLSKKTVLMIRKDLFDRLVYLPIKYFDTNAHGDIMSRMTNDVDSISSTISQSVASFISTIMIIIGAFTIMLLFSPLLTLVASSTIVLTLTLSRFLSKRMRKYFKIQQSMLGEINSKVEEGISGQKTVSAFTKERDLQKAFNKTSNELEGYAIKAQVYGGAMGPIMNVVGNIGFLLVVVFGAIFSNLEIGAGLFGPITIGTIIMFTNCSKQVNRPLNEVAQLFAQIETSLAAAERVFAVMDTDKEINQGTISIPSDFKVEVIEFKNVCFSYVPNEPVLVDFNLKVESGQKIALVGHTGSGKTTVVNLLMRFYDIDSGSIEINGIDIRNIKKEDLRNMVSIVLQDTVLFSDTIENNIKYGEPNATVEEVLSSSKLANSHKFIKHLENKYETYLANSGANLSQGQRQLITIARAAITNPLILILDEATSSVDTRTEKNIQDAMVNLMKERTSLIIAHRLSTIRDADKIVVMDHGRVIEIGNHEELIKKQGTYYKLYQTQFAGNVI